MAHDMTHHEPHPLPRDHDRSRAPAPPASPARKVPRTPTATSDAVIAAGPALARAEQRIATRRQQTALVLATLTVAGAALATGHHGALAFVPACVVAAIALT